MTFTGLWVAVVWKGNNIKYHYHRMYMDINYDNSDNVTCLAYPVGVC